MKRSLKKGAAILLTLCMILTLIPQYAYAGGESIVQRTTKLSLGNPSEQFGYMNTDGIFDDNAFATDKITDSAEGWEWYPGGDSAQDYDDNTLVLKGINLETNNTVAITLPAGSTIILKDNTTNVVRSTSSQNQNIIGIDCNGELTIKGEGTLEVQSGDGTSFLNTSTAISAAGDLNIESGTIRAMGQTAHKGSTGLFSTGVVKISRGNITAKSGNTLGISAAIMGVSVIIEDGTVYAQASLDYSNRYSILSNDGDGIETGIVTTGMVVRYNTDDNYTGKIELHRTEDNKMYYSMVDPIEGVGENAYDILIQKAPPGASISEKTISGVAGSKLSGSPTMTISLTGCMFIELDNNTDISSWFTNLPDGLIVTLHSVASDGSSASIGFGGTPMEASDSAMLINIPSKNLSIDEPVTVDTNSNAKFAITGGEPSAPQKRTNSLDLTVTELSYKASGSAEPAYANPSISNITNTVEGWKWYRYADEERGYTANTLELRGIDLTTTALVGIKLPVGATIIISDNTTNTVKSIYVPDGSFIPGGDFTYGIHCLGDLSIKGDTGSLAVSSGNPSTGDTSGVMAAGSLTIDGGNITAIGGVSSTSFQKISTGIRANGRIAIRGDGTIYAKADYNTKSRPVFSEEFMLITEGMEAYQMDSETETYTIPARTYNGVFVYAKGQYSNLAASDVRITPLPLPGFGGKGTESNPYLIKSKEELKEMAWYVNEYNSKYGNKHYKLMDDIILNEDGNGSPEQWTVIGLNSDKPFSGVFDGGNHTLKGILINDFTTSYAGLFGYIKDGVVKNVGMKGGQVSALVSNSYAGGISGYNDGGWIEDCFNTSSIVGTQSGGIAGYNRMGHIQDSYNTGNVAGFVAGGIAGVNQDADLTIVNCYNTGSVKAMKNNDSVYAGGITGKNYSATIKNSYNAGEIAASGIGNGQVNLGGVFGRNLFGNLIDVYWIDSSLPIGYVVDNTVDGIEVKTSSELMAMAEILNENVHRLSEEYTNLASWIDDAKNENGGYPLFKSVTNYKLTIQGRGTGATEDGSYAAGTIVSIHAGTKEGSIFNGWTKEGGGSFGDASNSVTTFTMPVGDVTITANWKSTAGGGTGGNKTGNEKKEKPKGTEILINGKSQTAGKSETVKDADGRTRTTVIVDSDKLKTILSAEKEGAKVTIPIKDGVNAGEGKLTGEMIKSMEVKRATLVIQKGNSSYTLPAAEINITEVSKKLGTNVSLEDITVSVKISEPENTMAKVVESAGKGKGFILVAPAVEFTITCTYGGKSVNTASFNSYVERTIAIPEGVDPLKITTGIVVEPSGTIYHVPTRVTVSNGNYYAVINSLTNSTYSVIWNAIEFSDMMKHWAKESVNNMGARMVVTGVGNNSYEPGRNMTRAEFAAIMVRALGLAPDSGASTFGDVKASSWYSGYIKTAVSYGIIKGYDNGNFGPNDTITREQAMAMLARAMKVTGLQVDLTDQSIHKLIGSYTDSTAISAYAKESVAACLETGITAGRGNNSIAPKSYITRAEVAVMAERLLKKSDLI